MRKKLGVQDRRVIAYVGSFGGWYLTEEMLDFFVSAREYDRSSFALILTARGRDKIIESLKSRGFADDDFYVSSVSPFELPEYLAAADTAVSFIKACYSKQSSSPTKIAEYLACGLPIVSNRGVGDIDALIENNKVGVLIDEFSATAYIEALKQIDRLGDIGLGCRELAAAEFDLERVGGERYRSTYGQLLSANKGWQRSDYSTMRKVSEKFEFREIVCPVCGADNTRQLGFRGGDAHHAGLGVRTTIVRCLECTHQYPNPMPFPRIGLSELYGGPRISTLSATM